MPILRPLRHLRRLLSNPHPPVIDRAMRAMGGWRVLRGFAGVALTLAIAAHSAWADDPTPAPATQQPIPAQHGHVTDLTGTLSAEQRKILEDELTALQTRKGSQIDVLLVATTLPEQIEQYSIRVVDAWKPGRKSVDDGVLVLVAMHDAHVRIEVGRGLEGAIPDATAIRIINDYVTPKFKAKDFFGGLRAATGALTRLIDGEALPPPPKVTISPVMPALLLGFVAIALLRKLLDRLAPVQRAVAVAVPGAVIGGLVSHMVLVVLGLLAFGLLLGWIKVSFNSTDVRKTDERDKGPREEGPRDGGGFAGGGASGDF